MLWWDEENAVSCFLPFLETKKGSRSFHFNLFFPLIQGYQLSSSLSSSDRFALGGRPTQMCQYVQAISDLFLPAWKFWWILFDLKLVSTFLENLRVNVTLKWAEEEWPHTVCTKTPSRRQQRRLLSRSPSRPLFPVAAQLDSSSCLHLPVFPSISGERWIRPLEQPSRPREGGTAGWGEGGVLWLTVRIIPLIGAGWGK